MAEAQTEAAKRNTGPMAVNFLDAEAKSHKRIPEAPKAISVVVKGVEQPITLDPAELSDNIKSAMLVKGIAQGLKVFVANHAEEDGSNVPELTAQFWANLKSGKLYSRSENGDKPGRKFDGSIYAEAWRSTYAFMAKKNMKKKDQSPIKPLDDTQVLDLQTQLEAMEVKERTARIKSYKENKIFAKALFELQNKDKETDTDAEMPF